MRLAMLFLRSRQTERAAFALAGVIGGAWLWGRFLRDESGALWLALLLFPLFVGCLLGVVTPSPFAELERTASRTLFDLRAFQLGGLFLIAAAGLLAATWAWPEPDSSELIARNLSGFAGLSLLTAVVVEGRLAWIGPIIYGFGIFSFVSHRSSEAWAWAASPAGEERAIALAVILFVASLVLVSRFGARELQAG